MTGWSGQFFKLAEGWLSRALLPQRWRWMVPTSASAKIWQILGEMTFSVECRGLGKAGMTA